MFAATLLPLAVLRAGVIWKGDKLIEGVPETLDLLRAMVRHFIAVPIASRKQRKEHSETRFRKEKVRPLRLSVQATALHRSASVLLLCWHCGAVQGKRLVFVTNNSTKSRKQYGKKFESLGLSVTEEEIFASSFAAAAYFKSINFPADKKVGLSL